MIVDTSVLVAILLEEAGWQTYAAAMVDAQAVLLPAPAYVEVAMVLDGRLPLGAQDDRLDRLISNLGIKIAVADDTIARAARAAFSRYGRGRTKPGTPVARLNFGDCLVYATARVLNQPLLFKGDDFNRTDITPALPAGANP